MPSPKKTVEDQLKDANEIIRHRNAENTMLKRELRDRFYEIDSAEKIRREIYGLNEYTPEPPKWIDREPGKSTTGIPVIPLGDWHWGEVVDKDQVGGANEFNRRIAKQRVRVLYDTVNDLCFNHMTNPNYPGAIVPLVGDMITGVIHDDLRETNDGPMMWSVMEVEEQIIGLLNGWADKFGKLFVPCVPGNHGRNTIKPRINNRVYESYEWNIYQHLERYFRNDPRVTIHVPNEVDAHFTVFGHRFMLTHGDTLGVKGGDGIIGALGPIARGAMKVGRSEATIGRDFDTLIIGHYHMYIPRGDATPVMMNGTLMGYNTYARLQLRVPFSRPSQSLAFVHPKHGFTAQWPMYLDKKVLAKSVIPWVTYDKVINKPWDLNGK